MKTIYYSFVNTTKARWVGGIVTQIPADCTQADIDSLTQTMIDHARKELPEQERDDDGQVAGWDMSPEFDSGQIKPENLNRFVTTPEELAIVLGEEVATVAEVRKEREGHA